MDVVLQPKSFDQADPEKEVGGTNLGDGVNEGLGMDSHVTKTKTRGASRLQRGRCLA